MNEIDELKKEIDNLKKRITDLERKIAICKNNSNVKPIIINTFKICKKCNKDYNKC